MKQIPEVVVQGGWHYNSENAHSKRKKGLSFENSEWAVGRHPVDSTEGTVFVLTHSHCNGEQGKLRQRRLGKEQKRKNHDAN